MENSKHVLVTPDINHPSVEVIEVTAQARGWLDQDITRELLKKVCHEHNIPAPRHVSLGIALQRAMAELSSGPGRDLRTTGKKGTAVYTVMDIHLDKLDREEHDGKDVARSEVSARIVCDPNNQDAYSIKVSPPEHPSAAYIRERHDYYCGMYSCTYDLKPWLMQEALPVLGAIKSPDAQGKYFLKATEQSRKALLGLQEAFADVTKSEYTKTGGKLRLHMLGHSSGDASMVDLVMDAIIDEADRTCSAINTMLEENDEGKRTLGKRALATQTERAVDLRRRLKGLAESLGLGLEDVEVQITEMEKRIGIAELALS